VVNGAKVAPLRGVGPHSHPLTEISKRGSVRAEPRLLAELLSPREVCHAKGLNEVLAVGPVRGAWRRPGSRGLARARFEGLGVDPGRRA
jgi:hypothetical protein